MLDASTRHRLDVARSATKPGDWLDARGVWGLKEVVVRGWTWRVNGGSDVGSGRVLVLREASDEIDLWLGVRIGLPRGLKGCVVPSERKWTWPSRH